MSVSQQSQIRTRMFARVIGLYLVVASAAALLRFSDLSILFSELPDNSAFTWLGGVLALMFGLVIVALHPYWHGAAAIIVSVMGWIATLKGALLLAFPSAVVSLADGLVTSHALWASFCIALGLVGVYLAYLGWAPGPP